MLDSWWAGWQNVGSAMFEFKPDFDDVLKRFEAWWNCEVLDRPLVSISFPRPENEQIPAPEGAHGTLRERWLDTEYVVESAVARMTNTVFYADALPVVYPNLGPEIFSAFYGCDLEFGEETSWSKPILKDWRPETVAKLKMDTDGFWFRKIMEITDAVVEAGKGRFIVGYIDLHGGADAIAAFRDPEQLCLDMIEASKEIKALNERITKDYLRVYDIFYDKLSAAGMPSTTWIPAVCSGKMYVPSNDFSCMISDEMFEDVFLSGIADECAHMDQNIYHLDGPQALRYLDTLMDIPKMSAIQWVPGAGQEYWGDWIEVYQRIQAAGKGFVVYVPVQDLNKVIEVLRPEGAWLSLSGVNDRETADAALRTIAEWGR